MLNLCSATPLTNLFATSVVSTTCINGWPGSTVTSAQTFQIQSKTGMTKESPTMPSSEFYNPSRNLIVTPSTSYTAFITSFFFSGNVKLINSRRYGRPAWDNGGLSSRTISGETLGMCDPALAGKHSVALSLDAKLVPLWRKMCQYADSKIGHSSPQPPQPPTSKQSSSEPQINPWRKTSHGAHGNNSEGLSAGPRWSR